MAGAMRVPLVTYLSSFLIVSVVWVFHHMAFTSRLQALNYGLVWRNLLFLMLLGLVPFTTRAINEYPNVSLVAILYGLGIVLTVVAFFWLWAYASSGRNAFMRAGMLSIEARNGQFIGSAIVIVIGLAFNIGLAIWSKASFPGFAQVLWLVLAAITVQAQIMGDRFNDLSTKCEVAIISVVIVIAVLFNLIYVDKGQAMLFGKPQEIGFALLYVPPLSAIALLVTNIVRSGRILARSRAADTADNTAARSRAADTADNTAAPSGPAADTADNTAAPSGPAADTADNTAAPSGPAADTADNTAAPSGPIGIMSPPSGLIALLLFVLGFLIGRRR